MAGKASAIEKKLLKHLRDIGAEVQAVEDEDGSMPVTSNFESLARSTWREAMGGYVTNDHVNKDGTVTKVRVFRAPDKTCRAILFDHLLGKPKPQSVTKDDSRTPKAPPAPGGYSAWHELFFPARASCPHLTDLISWPNYSRQKYS